MDTLTLSTGTTPHGLHTILLESRYLRVVVLPEAGGRIWQITYKPLEADLLWNNPSVPPALQPLHAGYDDVWSGGWDELFPNDEAATVEGNALPDHGELWTGEWSAEPGPDEGSEEVHLHFVTPISHFLVEKTLLLRPECASLEIRYRFTNQGAGTFPFLWKLHPAFAVSSQHRIDFPPMAVIVEQEYPGTLEGAPPIFPWPYAPLNDTVLDLRQVPDVSSRAMHFFYGTGFAAGWCGITNRANGLASALRFDPEVFSSCWLFATYGGWRDLNVVVLEPATGYPYKIQSMIDSERARRLAPGKSLETTVLFSVQEGLQSIGGVEADGRILPGDEN
jgi:galactose mutarotase-like enzyme